ncbi:hypothetical protein M409DRAFT_27310 [Zasmidium cellare ATCC 36951]|uniref:Secreted protein CSS2 C-terminal domain-containing protein n=1 Tax=Zasmidium cellare ATCC 36951 TaxID=1080233 RepID=A0A6A6CA28_ZASCE|nr:uncharacterized protein M409DRAFT_27310 [Zasmidium cellare ATCC 36951]KAF2162306.1 hypothetical protein M409DRAFT_27310 [Zasmidium cellare ATCC 36951]
MKLSLIVIAATFFVLLNSYSTSSLSIANDSPDRWAQIDLEAPLTNTSHVGVLEKRRHIGVCELVSVAASCVVLINWGYSLVSGSFNYISNFIYETVHADFACEPHVGAYKELKFKFQAYGGDCHTSAQRKTIMSGIESHFKANGGKICGTECLRLDHRRWNGYLLLGLEKTFDKNRLRWEW